MGEPLSPTSITIYGKSLLTPGLLDAAGNDGPHLLCSLLLFSGRSWYLVYDECLCGV